MALSGRCPDWRLRLLLALGGRPARRSRRPLTGEETNDGRRYSRRPFAFGSLRNTTKRECQPADERQQSGGTDLISDKLVTDPVRFARWVRACSYSCRPRRRWRRALSLRRRPTTTTRSKRRDSFCAARLVAPRSSTEDDYARKRRATAAGCAAARTPSAFDRQCRRPGPAIQVRFGFSVPPATTGALSTPIGQRPFVKARRSPPNRIDISQAGKGPWYHLDARAFFYSHSRLRPRVG